MSKMPPKWAMRFFHWFCRRDLVDAIEGDLLEIYARRAEAKGRRHANIRFIGHVITFFQPFAFRRAHEQYPQLNPFHMFFNNLKIGFRFMKKHGTYSAINILGLAAGLSAFLLMSFFVMDELSYDKFHKKGDQIVRLTYRLETPNATRQGAKLPFPMKQALVESYPEVIDVARFYYWGGDTPLLEYGEQKHTEPGMYFAETSVFEVFDFEWVRGNPKTALEDPRSIVLTEKMAVKYFGSEDAIGKTMRYKNEDDLIVTGILKDVPKNSHISFDFLMPIELQRQRWMGWGQYTYDLEKDWNWAAAWVYALLAPETSIDAFESKLQAIAKEHLNTEDQDGFSIEVQRLFDIHLKSDKSAEPQANGNMTQVYSFAAIAILILFIACVNFINLTAAQTNKRLKEVGLRKVMGARKKQLIAQFMTEALMVVTFASVIAFAVAMATLPYFNQFTDKALSFGGQNLIFLIGLIVLVLVMTVLSALRPSMSVLRLSAVQGLINKFGAVRKKQRFNSAMVIAQFVVSNLLIIGILVVNNQLDFLQNKDLGFDKDRVVRLQLGKNLTQSQFDLFEDMLSKDPMVENINRGYVAGTNAFTNTFKIVGAPDNSTYSLGIKWIGEGFREMYGLEIISGRDFDESVSSDLKSGILINESAVKALGWTVEESVGKSLSFLPGGAPQPEEIRVIGVMADANFESLYDPVLPSVFRRTSSSVGGEITIRLGNGSGLAATLSGINEAWDKVIPDWPFEYTFLDETLEAQYVKEERLANAIQYFTLLAIFIACLGLFGLASFTVQQRTKEIGVRKVLGASLFSIFGLVSKKFVRLVLVSFLLSTPIAYYLFNQWLQGFAYRIGLGASVFLIAGFGSVLIAILAVGGQSLKAASSNPVKTLRYE
ncbi:hypothetical protein BFP97_18330 [Roseivirga sp. 4D4]|uniref:ABC transporter permease n=1 Tax=Roseivirga sp. 4D4 TaxID=1889784 RepID=UPI000852982D|nr:ABC transporter permease [Roseivirga sp. 4D4]OEK03359.1 hypothetical protein BFP97_18330 [Roseivirga sp. 4D4]